MGILFELFNRFCSIGMAITTAIQNAVASHILWFSDQEKAIEKVIIREELLNLLGFLDIQKTALKAWNRSLPSFELQIGLH